MWKYKFIFDKKVFCKNRRCICVSYLPSKLLLLLLTLLQVIFDQAKRLVVIVNIMHSLHLRNKLCLIIKICIFKNHFLVKNMLQTPQLSPYLLVSPHPSRFSSLLNLGHHFLSETETKLYWVQSETKTIYSPFTIWKMQSERIHLDSFLL